MRSQLLAVLACPACKGHLACSAEATECEDVRLGVLSCSTCARDYTIRGGIPRFVPEDGYAASFGYQWNLFRREQLDSLNGTRLSAERFRRETGWSTSEFNGKWVLDIGCGAGRFIDVAAGDGAQVVGVDLSGAVEAAAENLKGRPNAHVVQASLYHLPFRPGAFDAAYCIGVVQHTPDPVLALATLVAAVKPGGKVAVTMYERRPWTLLHVKYLLRPLTRELPPQRLFATLRWMMPVLFPLVELCGRLGRVGRAMSFLVPAAPAPLRAGLSLRQRYRWATLDTFDMLAPAFDLPQTEHEARETLTRAGLRNVRRLANAGLNLVGERPR